MTRFAIFLALIGIGHHASARQGAYAWPIDELSSRIESLSCKALLARAPEIDGPHHYLPRSEVPLRAGEYARILISGATTENAYNREYRAFFKKSQAAARAAGRTLDLPEPAKRVMAINVSREGMKRAWTELHANARAFTKFYSAAELAAISPHAEALARLNAKAHSLIGSLRANAEVQPIAESLGLTLAQIIDGARAAIDGLGRDREALLLEDPAAPENLSLIWEELADFAYLYQARFDARVVARLAEPEVREFLAREIKFVRRWRMYERGALESKRDRSRQAERAHRLIGVRLANDWKLLTREPRLSGRQMMALRDSLRNLRQDLIAYAPPRTLLPLDAPVRELMFAEALRAPLLLDVIRLAGAPLAPDVPPAGPVPVRPEFHSTTYKMTKVKVVDAAARRWAEMKDKPRLAAFAKELAEYELARERHRAAEHERRYQAQALYAAYETRAQARRILVTYLAFKDPLANFFPILGFDAEGRPTKIDVGATIQREAEATIARAADGATLTPEMYKVIEMAKTKAPPTLVREYARWMVYAYATLPKLFPGLDAPPRSIPGPKIPGEYRPPFFETF